MAEKKPTKKALLEAQRAELGKCRALKEDGEPCAHWATERVGEVPYCGQHAGGFARRAMEQARAAEKREALNASIDAYLARSGQVPHLCGDHCPYSSVPAD